MKKTKSNSFAELSQLFFEMKQTIRANVPQGHTDPNAWMRSETLRYIEENDCPTMQEIAKQFRITAPSATSLIKLLLSLGWIERKPSDSDKRVIRISLTKAGMREVTRYRKQSEKTMRKVFSKLPERDLAHLKRVLRSLNALHRA